MKIEVFLDSADTLQIRHAAVGGIVQGFTTNPSLMHRFGVRDYQIFSEEAIAAAAGLPISFEVLADDVGGMERDARCIAAWGDNVFVKIPISTPDGGSTLSLIEKLSSEGVALNVTALMTVEQVAAVSKVFAPRARAILSVFAGRIADCGCDPVPVMRHCAGLLAKHVDTRLLWASTRELLNIKQSGCHIITATADLIAKMHFLGRDMAEYSLETIRQFHADAHAAGYNLA